MTSSKIQLIKCHAQYCIIVAVVLRNPSHTLQEAMRTKTQPNFMVVTIRVSQSPQGSTEGFVSRFVASDTRHYTSTPAYVRPRAIDPNQTADA